LQGSCTIGDKPAGGRTPVFLIALQLHEIRYAGDELRDAPRLVTSSKAQWVSAWNGHGAAAVFALALHVRNPDPTGAFLGEHLTSWGYAKCRKKP
jgi:hypothetical protein